MKTLCINCLLILVVVLVVEITADCEYKGRTVPAGGVINTICAQMKCHEDGSFDGVGCATNACAPGKLIRTDPGDQTKVYPDCCERAICAD